MLKTVIKARICCPVVFHKKVIAIFRLKKSQIGTEIDKTQNFNIFMQFLANYRWPSLTRMLNPYTLEIFLVSVSFR